MRLHAQAKQRRCRQCPDARQRASQRSALVNVRKQRMVHDVGGHEQVVAAQLGGHQVAQRGRADVQKVIIDLM
jgi:hypothetical protein